jgi:pyruvate,water dikinase
MISAKSAGVIFTNNPVSLDKSQLIIESNYGLGESIVSGEITPDQFIIQKMGKMKPAFKIIDKRIGNKKISFHSKSLKDGSGIEQFNLPDHLNEKPSLSDKHIYELSKIGIAIEKLFRKKPQDIEWAIDKNNKIHILQSRPITSKTPFELEKTTLYSRGYSDDYWNDDTTPLFFDLLGDQITKVVNIELNSIMGYKRIDDKLLKLFKGHVYFNLDVIKRKVEYEIPTFIRNEDVLNYFPKGYGPYGKETIKSLPFRLLRRLFSEIRIRFYDPDGSMSKTAVKYEEWTNKIFEPYCREFDLKLENLKKSDNLKSLFNLAIELDQIMVSHFRLIRYGIPVHNIGMNLMTKYLLTRFIGKEESQNIFPILISGLDHKLTETNDRIHELASIIQNSSYLYALFQENDSEHIYKIIETDDNPEIVPFAKEFKNFLKDFGDRGFTREIYYPRWKEDPKLIFDILKSLCDKNYKEKINDKELFVIKRNKLERVVEKTLKSKFLGLLLWKFFSGVLKNSRKYIIFRENQRYNLDKWITRNKELFLKIGQIFLNKEIIKEEDEIFFLHKNEIKKIIFDEIKNSELELIGKIARERKMEFLKYQNIIPSKFLLGLKEFDDVLEFDENSSQFQGIPASNGIVTGNVRILRDINLIPSVQSGEILVVPRTDPGWTPIFSKIGGLITETGGILSHGAVVSREYRIPAVTNIPNACKLLKTGQRVTINGYNGTVFILE